MCVWGPVCSMPVQCPQRTEEGIGVLWNWSCRAAKWMLALGAAGKQFFDTSSKGLNPLVENCHSGACAWCRPLLLAHQEDSLSTPLGVYGVMVTKCAGVLKH